MAEEKATSAIFPNVFIHRVSEKILEAATEFPRTLYTGSSVSKNWAIPQAQFPRIPVQAETQVPGTPYTGS
jgi:hypothetical protein